MRWASSDQLRHSGATSSVASRHLPLQEKATRNAGSGGGRPQGSPLRRMTTVPAAGGNAGSLWLLLEEKLSWPIPREAMTDEVGLFGRGSSQRGPPHPSLRDTFSSRRRQHGTQVPATSASPQGRTLRVNGGGARNDARIPLNDAWFLLSVDIMHEMHETIRKQKSCIAVSGICRQPDRFTANLSGCLHICVYIALAVTARRRLSRPWCSASAGGGASRGRRRGSTAATRAPRRAGSRRADTARRRESSAPSRRRG